MNGRRLLTIVLVGMSLSACKYASGYPYLVVSADKGVMPITTPSMTSGFSIFSLAFFFQHISNPFPLPGHRDENPRV